MVPEPELSETNDEFANLGPFRWVKIKFLRQTSANFGKLWQNTSNLRQPSATFGKLRQTTSTFGKTAETLGKLQQTSANFVLWDGKARQGWGQVQPLAKACQYTFVCGGA